jgi:hypothetical protein
MSGWPSRVIRSLFGPELEDDYPVQNPLTDIPAAAHNLGFHQIAGLNVALLPRAVVVAEWTGGALQIYYQAEAWNASESQAHPVLARTGAGTYTLTFASTYLDKDANPVATALVHAKGAAENVVAAAADLHFVRAWIDTVNPLVVNIQIWQYGAPWALHDCRFSVEVG